MSALETVSDYIDDVRVLLQDTISPYRYDDASLLTALNLTLLETRRLRPDLFVFRSHQAVKVPSFTSNDDTEVEIEPQFRLALVYGVMAHALARDQEDVQDARASTFMDTFQYMLTGQRVRPNPAGGSPGK